MEALSELNYRHAKSLPYGLYLATGQSQWKGLLERWL